MNVTNVTGATVTDPQGLGIIINDDAEPVFSIADLAIVEGNAGTQLLTFTVTKTGATDLTHAVTVATADDSATIGDGDYTANNTVMTFLPADTAKPFAVPIHGDTNGDTEGNEQFFVDLSAATTGATISDNQAIGVIRTDDPLSISAVDTPFDESFEPLQSTGATTAPGWTFVESGTASDPLYTADTGSSSTGDTYSFGVAGTNAVTDRAFGGLRTSTLVPTFGAFYRNDTGSTITSLTITYTGEEWHLGTAGRADRLDFQYSLDATDLTNGAWFAVDALDFTTPNQAGTGAKDGNAAANRTQVTGQITGLSIAPGATFWIRFNDFNASGSDDGLAVDDIAIIANYTGSVLSIDDVTAFEGNAGATTFTFTVSLSAPAPAGGVTFNIATADGTATDADNDYEPINLVGETIAAGNTSAQYIITVNGDVTVEPTETFNINVSNVTNALVLDSQGAGTIIDDDTPLTLIHDIQGNGASSPMVGASVVIRGIVTGVTSNGFFVQEEEVDYDADPNTSEGIFVFTSSAPPAAAAFTAQVRVTGTVSEFVPSGDPQQPPRTEITSATTYQTLPPGQVLPSPIPLSPTFPDPAGAYDQLERVEHMRVTAASITVAGPSGGTVIESTATGSSNGIFHGTATGVARPFREAGIRQADTPPSGSIPPIPRWDFNPERLRIESASINSQPVLTVKSGDVVGPIIGPLDYGSRGYAIYSDGTLGTPVVTPGTLPTTVTPVAANEFTVASFNLRRLFDDVDDAYADAVPSTAAYNNRLAKASIAIRDHLRSPDIIGVQEVEKLAVLTDLRNKVIADGGPAYDVYLEEGNDTSTSLDVGFLVKTDPVTGGVARVSGVAVAQVDPAMTWIDPRDNSSQLLNERPPLVLTGTVNRTSTLSFPVVVIVNHLLDLANIDSSTVDGLTTVGDRVRQKRQAQATFLANYVQTRQTTTPTEHIVVVGDFNAFEVNDGYADVMNTIAGTPPPDNETVVPGDGVDLVNPNLTTLVNTPPAAERYSQVDAGNAGNGDHALVGAALVADTTARRIEHPRINADYPETERNDNATALRVSDRDPVVAYFTVGTLALTDLEVTKSGPGSVVAGTDLTYTITVTNNGPDTAAVVSLSDTLPANTTFVSFTQNTGPTWSCTTGGTISCSIASLPAGSTTTFELVVAVAPAAAGSILSNTASVSSSTTDADSGNDSATATTTVTTSADLSVAKIDTPDPVIAGTDITYTITVTNGGPSAASAASLLDGLPAGTTFQLLSAPGGWSCSTPAVGEGGTVSCTAAALGVGNAVFTLTVRVSPAVSESTAINNSALVSSATNDPNLVNNLGTAQTTVTNQANLSVTKVDTPDPVTAGNDITYTITLTNAGPSHPSATLSDVLPANTTFVSMTAAGWSCLAPFNGTVDCFPTGSVGVGSHVFTLKVNVVPSVASGTVLSNTATVASASDSSPGDNSATATTTVTTSADVAIAAIDAPDPVNAGADLSYTITVTNNGPSAAASVQMSDTLPAGTTFVSLASPVGWSCTTPALGAGGTVSCSRASLNPGSAVFDLVVRAAPSVAAGTVLSNTATVTSSTTDAAPGNNSATATTTVNTSADLAITNPSSGSPVTAGTNLTYTITVTNHGPSEAASVSLSDTLPGDATFVSLSSPAGWTCTTPAVGASGTIACSRATLGAGSFQFTLTVKVSPSATFLSFLTNTATAASTVTDANAANNSSTASNLVSTIADVALTATPAPNPVTAGTNVTYTITAINNGPSTATTATMSEFTSTNDRFVSISAPGGWSCTTPAAGAEGPVSCIHPAFGLDTPAVFTLVRAVAASTPAGTNAHSSATVVSDPPDGVGNNVAISLTPVVAVADVSTSAVGTPGPVNAGSNISYTISVATNGPSHASAVTVTHPVPASTTFVSAAVLGGTGWTVTAPSTGGTGNVVFSKASLPPGDTAQLQIVVNVAPGTAGGTIGAAFTIATSATDSAPGNNSSGVSTTVNGAPTITDVPNQTINEDTPTTALSFTIDDDMTSAASLTVTASSSDQTLVPNANLALGGAAGSRTVTVTPALNQNGGPVTITITVGDGVLSANETFTVMVTPVNDPPTITAIANQTIAANTSTAPLAFTIGDVETAAAGLTVSATSSNPLLVLPAGFAFAGTGANRTLTATPIANASGTATIAVTVHDGTAGTATNFLLTVNPLSEPSPPPPPPTPTPTPTPPSAQNQAPSITGLVNATIEENGSLAVTLDIGDDITAVENLTLTATSSNQSVVPASGLRFSGTHAIRTLTITPALDTPGPTTISVTVMDEGSERTTIAALVNVNGATAPPPPPTGFTAVATASGVVLTWHEPLASPHPSFFVVEGGTAPGASTLPVINTVTRRTTWTLALPPGTYSFRARSGNRVGTSGASNEAGVIVTSAPNVPGAPTRLQVSVESTRATFAWQRPVTGGEATAWILELDTAPGPALRASGTAGDLRTFRMPAGILNSAIDLPRGEYVARVRGENSAGVGPPSNEPRFTIDLPAGGGCDAPEAPVLLPPSINGYTVTLTWRPPRRSGAVSYRVLLGSVPGGSNLRVVEVGPVSALVFTAPPGVYHATIVASNSCGSGAASNSEPVVVTGVGPPPPPSNVRFQIVGPNVTLAWDPSPGAVSYLIEVGTTPGASDALLYPLAGTSVTAPDAPSGTWFVRVRAIGAGGVSLPSAEIVVVVP